MSRAASLAELYKASVKEYTKTPKEWKGLLSCAARFYKHSFDNAVLIYAQKPDATQLGTYDEWHDKRIGRSINRGAKGIAVIDMKNPHASIKYLFDFMDTNGSAASYRNLQRFMWELEEQYRPAVLRRFQEKYDIAVSGIEESLYELICRKAGEILVPYMENLQIEDETSLLYGMPEDAVKAEFAGLVTESAAYTVFSKCGLSSDHFCDERFTQISNYNNLQLFIALGNCTMSVARVMLQEIYEEIQAVKSERSRSYEDRTPDGFHLQRGEQRNDVSGNQDIGQSTDRPDTGGPVRETVEGIYDREIFGPAVGAGGTGQDQRSYPAGGQGSRGEKREDHSGTAGRPAHAGYDGHNGESRTYEHDNKDSRGNRNGRNRVEKQVTSAFATSAGNVKPPEDGEKPSAGGFFIVLPEQWNRGFADDHLEEEEISGLVDEILCAGDLFPDAEIWHFEICRYFQREDRLNKKEDALKMIYGSLDEQYVSKENHYHLHVSGNHEGLILETEGNTYFFSYGKLAKRIDALILDGNYPFSIKEERLDDFAIPDELEELKESRRNNKADANEKKTGAQPGGKDNDTDQKDKVKQTEEDADLTVESSAHTRQLSLFEVGMQTEITDTESGNAADMKAWDKADQAGADTVPDKQPHQPGMDGAYRYQEAHRLYEGGPKTKVKNNIEAIRLLKQLQKQGRMATEQEQLILAKYVGWGGLANALTEGKSGWESQYEEIKNLLTEEEFQAVQESTPTAYYTEQNLIRYMYDALERFGFRGGNILDPSTGTGNFFSVLPESMKNSRLYGVEIEPVSGQIAKYLYPDADIQVTGFENTDFPDQFFDLVIGNIPFNSVRINDPGYNRHHFKIHDYFLAKSLGKTRPGGIVAVITSKYTMDRENYANRKYLAQRAELMGAIRLPNDAFKRVAGTETTTDILFLKKRSREIVPDEENSPWLSVERNADGVPVNTWFINHPEMILGKMVFDESVYGNENSTACHPVSGDDLHERLGHAIRCLEGRYEEPAVGDEIPGNVSQSEGRSIAADPSVRNFSYALTDGRLYYREHSRMYEQDIKGKKAERIKGLVEITQAVRSLIDFQNRNYREMEASEYETVLRTYIATLNTVYDRFVKDYGYINARANVMAFSQDASAPLLRSIEKEKQDEKGVFEKTAIFYKATIRPKILPSVVYSAEEALNMSLNVKGRLDLDYMAELYRNTDGDTVTKDELIAMLGDQIYQDPVMYAGNPYAGWQTAGEYLSGYVKDKLAEAMQKAEEEPDRFLRNVEALRQIQPVPLTPQEISFSLGTTWIPTEIYQEFMYEIFKTSEGNRTGPYATTLEFSGYSGVYHIANKGNERDSITAGKVYGTERMNAYEILEISLNLRFVEVRDRVEYRDPDTGEEKVKYVLNKKETILAREKQAQIKAEFERWLFSSPERGTRLTKLYNNKFNNIRPRVYDGSGLVLPDLSEDIRLRPHQLDVVAHGLYGDGNLLIAHEVGTGKTFSGITLAHEMKRLGMASKPLITVPNHLLGQWAADYMRLYPNDNILIAEEKDFRKQNRRRFISRIATGGYDCIIMPHSSFELIGLSRERQLAAMRAELDAVTNAIDEQKVLDGKDWSLKQMQIFRKNLQFRFDRLFNAAKKDDVINFEELGVDAMIVDEAHVYKNNFSYTKMRNVAGISSQSSQRAMDMHQKSQYINEINNGRGVIYLTGTVVSNFMAELYVIQKTLQPQELERRGILSFDAWAGTFSKITSALEIRPEGNGYQMKNRFSQFHNLPELMSMFSIIADIKTSDMLDLPVPVLKTGKPQIIKSVCTPEQKRIVMELAERAEAIRSGAVDSSRDNFLKLTHEARLLSIDPRAIEPGLPDEPGTKLNLCAENVAKIYHDTAEAGLTQLIFCDQGTPKYDGSFNFYEATKKALIGKGVKAEEISFIHDAKTDMQREQLFEKVRGGVIRILMGSTEKMGTGMNVQKKLAALHHLDVPWRPADLTQRNGRIVRQGNENDEVSIFNYITENTFDSYLWQILEQKQRYISQIMTGRSPLRTCEDLDETVLQYAEFKALATSDPRVKEKMETDNEINRLTVLKASWQSQQNDLHHKINRYYPLQIARKEKEIAFREEDVATYRMNRTEDFKMVIDGRTYAERAKAAEHLMVVARRLGMGEGESLTVGNYTGFTVRLVRKFGSIIDLHLCGKGDYRAEFGDSELGNITRIVNLAERIESEAAYDRQELDHLKQQFAAAKEEYGRPFRDEDRLVELQKKKVQLDLALEFKEDSGDLTAAEEQINENIPFPDDQQQEYEQKENDMEQ